MTAELGILLMTAVSVGFLHTILGPDHYVPFVAMARSNGWSPRKTFFVTSLCGLGHIVGSVLIGAVGLILGTVILHLEALESFRGDTAAWLLIGFGLAYLTWGILRAVRDVPHTHVHSHADGIEHSHLHRHDLQHRHLHDVTTVEEDDQRPASHVTPWVLFLIFAFGPCEVLIPLLMYPAAEANFAAIVAVVLAFALTTVLTMVTAVMLIVFGLKFVRFPDLHPYSHAIAGSAVLLCGVLVKFGL